MSSIGKLEEQLEMNKLQSEKGALISKLLDNPDFRKIILDDFCRDEVVRNMAFAGDPAATEDMRADCLSAAYAGGHLKRYLVTQVKMGEHAASQVTGINAEIEELRADEDAD